eukprot:6345028-Pyramimonas_sp.AAC.1
MGAIRIGGTRLHGGGVDQVRGEGRGRARIGGLESLGRQQARDVGAFLLAAERRVEVDRLRQRE